MASLAARMKAELWRAKSLAELRRSGAPKPEIAPTGGAQRRVFIGPANSAGQGYQWARALERQRPDVAATSMQFVRPASFRFTVDQAVASGYGAYSRSWQRAQAKALKSTDAVIVESALPVLGGYGDGDAFSQIRELQDAGVRVALLFHGSDLRDPDGHLEREPASYFGVDEAFTAEMRAKTARSRELARQAGVPLFVSTLDLLTEIPEATWLPVVVDVSAWATVQDPFAHGGTPRVVYVPSNAHIKGSDLIEGTLRDLHARAVIDLHTVTGVAHAEMPAIFGAADIVLDQFRGGPYGVAACEAMAAGRIVVSHVPYRERIHDHTGEHVPIIEATHETLAETLMNIIADPTDALTTASRGPGFVTRHHDGTRSGAVLAEWLHEGER